MSKNLLDFLVENPASDLTEEFCLNKRIPFKFKIQAFTGKEINGYRMQAKPTVSKKGEVSMDTAKLMELVCVNHTLEPNFNDAAAIKKAGVNTGRELLNKVLAGGEIETLYQRIAKLSGYDSDINEDIEEAKN